MSAKVPVLFTQPRSVYDLLGCDTYNLARSAYSFQDNRPVIAHPPCRLWSRLRKFSTAPRCEMLTAIWAVYVIRQNGGVLEHPAASALWPFMQLPLPGHYDSYGGYSISINQHWFGHKARKNTLLYIKGVPLQHLPSIPLNFDAVTHCVSSSKKKLSRLPALSKKERSATPLAFAKWLIQVQQLIVTFNEF